MSIVNVFGKDIELQTEEVCFRGGSVVVSESTDEEYHRHVAIPMADTPRDTPDDVAEFNREATLRMLAISLMPALGCSFDEVYDHLRIPGKYSRSAINALVTAMNRVNAISGNSQTATSE